MPMREMKLSEARKHLEAGKLEAIAIAGLDGWPGDVRLTVTVSEELAAEIDGEKIVATPPAVVNPVAPVAPVVDAPKPGRKPKVINQEENQAMPPATPAPAPVEPAAPTPAPAPEPVAEEPEEEAA